MLISRELDIKTLTRMHHIYCRCHHNPGKTGDLCDECQSVLDYSLRRTESCKWKESGRLCSNCEVHCFEDTMRLKIKEIMRFAGPRLIFTNPLLSIRYLLLKFR